MYSTWRSDGQAEISCGNVAEPRNRPLDLIDQGDRPLKSATISRVALRESRGSKNTQRLEPVAVRPSFLSPLSFSFSLILKEKRRKERSEAETCGVAKSRQSVAKVSEAVVLLPL